MLCKVYQLLLQPSFATQYYQLMWRKIVQSKYFALQKCWMKLFAERYYTELVKIFCYAKVLDEIERYYTELVELLK